MGQRSRTHVGPHARETPMTPMDGNPPPARLARRSFLGALALAPAALACATPGAARPAAGSGPVPPMAEPAGSGEDRALAAVRAVPLTGDSEPAIVFRAAAARPGTRR